MKLDRRMYRVNTSIVKCSLMILSDLQIQMQCRHEQKKSMQVKSVWTRKVILRLILSEAGWQSDEIYQTQAYLVVPVFSCSLLFGAMLLLHYNQILKHFSKMISYPGLHNCSKFSLQVKQIKEK